MGAQIDIEEAIAATVSTFLDGRVTLHSGDCLAVMSSLPENSVDAVICDPPYHLHSIVKRFSKTGRTDSTASKSGPHQRTGTGFMNKTWDGGDIAFQVDTWERAFRVLKPGGYILAFSSSRTFGRMSVAIEDAGFITHPMVGWMFGQGFPKAHKVAHPDWNGWAYGGQALKPAFEPIYMGQKPFSEKNGTLNVLRWGVGALNIDGCRVHVDGGEAHEREGETSQDQRCDENGAVNIAAKPGRRYKVKRLISGASLNKTGGNWRPEDSDVYYEGTLKQGRHPANLMHDGSACVVAMFPNSDGQQADLKGDEPSRPALNVYGEYKDRRQFEARNDNGSAARFFWSSKAAADDRLGSKHPTVKPIDLMQELVRLVTPKGGTVLDPFSGTGTTGEAAWREGMKAILIEREPEYQADIARRMQLATQPTKRAAVAKSKNQLDRPEDMPLFNVGEPK